MITGSGSGVRRGLASGSQSPLVTNSRTLSSTLPRKNVKENDLANSTLDDWEQKLLGKKSAVPYVSPGLTATATPSVKSETLSIQSSNHSSRSNTLERNRKEAKSSAAIITSGLATLPTHQVHHIYFIEFVFKRVLHAIILLPCPDLSLLKD